MGFRYNRLLVALLAGSIALPACGSGDSGDDNSTGDDDTSHGDGSVGSGGSAGSSTTSNADGSTKSDGANGSAGSDGGHGGSAGSGGGDAATTDTGSDAPVDTGTEAAHDATSNDGGSNDATSNDATTNDATSSDAASNDATANDGGSNDATSDDGSSSDVNTTDSGTGDDGAADAGSGDDGAADAGSGDDGAADAGSGDDGAADAGSGDDGAADAGSGDDGASDAGSGDDGSNDVSSGGGDAGSDAQGDGDAGTSLLPPSCPGTLDDYVLIEGTDSAETFPPSGSVRLIYGNGGNDDFRSSWGGADCDLGGDGDDHFMHSTNSEGSSVYWTGGAGDDHFELEGGSGIVHIADFGTGSDKIWLGSAVYGIGSESCSTCVLPGSAIATGEYSDTVFTTPEQRFFYEPGTGLLYFDADGSGGESSSYPILQIDNHDTYTYNISDFINYGDPGWLPTNCPGALGDYIYTSGSTGDDVFGVGSSGNRFINGKEGNDTFNPDFYVDCDYGGPGNDHFLHNSSNEGSPAYWNGGDDADVFEVAGGGGVAHIGDFEGGSDRIWLASSAYALTAEYCSPGQCNLSGFFTVSGTNYVSNDGRLSYDTLTGIMTYDADGSGSESSPVAILQIDNYLTYTFDGADFYYNGP